MTLRSIKQRRQGAIITNRVPPIARKYMGSKISSKGFSKQDVTQLYQEMLRGGDGEEVLNIVESTNKAFKAAIENLYGTRNPDRFNDFEVDYLNITDLLQAITKQSKTDQYSFLQDFVDRNDIYGKLDYARRCAKSAGHLAQAAEALRG